MISKKTKIYVLFIVLLTFAIVPAKPASAQMEMMLDLPPGIEAQAQPLMEQMMLHMQEMEMTPMQMQMMMQDMQMMANTLPPGIFLQIMELMLQLEMPEMMVLHQAIQQGLLQQPPGQVLTFVIKLSL